MAWHQGYLCILEGFEMQRKIYFVLMLLWMGVIFGFSAQPAAESTQTSLRVGRLVCGIFVKDYEEMSAAEQTALAENIEFPIRKAAHASEYALLGILVFGVVRKKEMTKRQMLCAILVTAFYAASDEQHQFFVPGRSCQLRDVLIDTAGGVAGVGIQYILLKHFRKMEGIE